MQLTLDFEPPVTVDQLDEFTRAYIEAALWSTSDDENADRGEFLDYTFDAWDIHPDTLARMARDCRKFQAENTYDIRNSRTPVLSQTSNEDYAGHDFWLTRNRHGCGFWDGGWRRGAGERLTKAAHAFGEFTLYLGDDGKIHGC